MPRDASSSHWAARPPGLGCPAIPGVSLSRGAGVTCGRPAAVHPHRTARGDVGVGSGLGQLQHRIRAGVGAGEHRDPMVPRAGDEDLRDRRARRGPVRAVVLPGQQVAAESQPVQQLGVELALDGPDRHPPAVRARVDAVERCGAGEDPGTPALPLAAAELAELREQQVRGAVHHPGVNHLAAAGALAGQQGEHGAQDRRERAAREVAQQVQRGHRGSEPTAPSGPPIAT